MSSGKRIAAARRRGLVSEKDILARRRAHGVHDGPAVVMRRQRPPTDDLFCTGNGVVHADWNPGRQGDSKLVTVPLLSWFHPRHKRHVRVASWSVSLSVNGEPTVAGKEILTWYAHGALPNTWHAVARFGHEFKLTVTGFCPPGEPAFVQVFHFDNNSAKNLDVCLQFNGNLCLGDENHFTRGQTMAYPDCPLEPLPPPAVTCSRTANGIRVLNSADGMAAALEGSCKVESTEFSQHEESHRVSGDWRRLKPCTWRTESQDFRTRYCLRLPRRRMTRFRLILCMGRTSNDVQKRLTKLRKSGTCVLQRRTAAHWRTSLKPFARVRVPDKLLHAALLRCCAYTKMNSVPMGREHFLISDHRDFVLDMPRDSFYMACALLYFSPDDVKGYLRFLFHNAIPRNGVGCAHLASGHSPHKSDGVFLLDLVSYPFLLLHRYWRVTGDGKLPGGAPVRDAIEILLRELKTYRCAGNGLYVSHRRSSDEPCLLPCFVPGTMLLYSALQALRELAEELLKDQHLAGRLAKLASRVRSAVYRSAVVEHKRFGKIFAFEVSEDGRYILYDHADMPNLLTAPYFGFCAADDPVYRNTLRFIYSADNEGFAHTADGRYRGLCDGTKTIPDGPWPMALMGRLLTTPGKPDDVQQALDLLRQNLTPSLQVPEIVDKHQGQTVSRSWFAWPTAMLVLSYVETICGIRAGKDITISPHPPSTWNTYRSPELMLRGKRVRVVVRNGKANVWVNGKPEGRRNRL